MYVPTLSPQHYRQHLEQTAGPVLKLVESLSTKDPARLEAFRREYEKLVETSSTRISCSRAGRKSEPFQSLAQDDRFNMVGR